MGLEEIIVSFQLMHSWLATVAKLPTFSIFFYLIYNIHLCLSQVQLVLQITCIAFYFIYLFFAQR